MSQSPLRSPLCYQLNCSLIRIAKNNQKQETNFVCCSLQESIKWKRFDMHTLLLPGPFRKRQQLEVGGRKWKTLDIKSKVKSKQKLCLKINKKHLFLVCVACLLSFAQSRHAGDPFCVSVLLQNVLEISTKREKRPNKNWIRNSKRHAEREQRLKKKC